MSRIPWEAGLTSRLDGRAFAWEDTPQADPAADMCEPEIITRAGRPISTLEPTSMTMRFAPRRSFAAWFGMALGLSGLAAIPGSVLAQVSPEESARKIKPAEGLEATLWASEPMVVNPTNMDIDSRGRVWVTEGLNYRLTRAATRSSTGSTTPTRSRSSKTPTATARPTR